MSSAKMTVGPNSTLTVHEIPCVSNHIPIIETILNADTGVSDSEGVGVE